jgi:cytochrome b pre-mRNA-processing protein 3
MSLGRLFRRRRDGAAETLYHRIVDQARRPELYRALGVPDTLDGRFEMLALHLYVVLHRLRRAGGDAACAPLAQALADRLIVDLDANLRQMGAGDLGVGRRVRQMAEAFNGRLAAYDAGLAGGASALEQAVRRNVYGTTEPTHLQVVAMAAYLRASLDVLAGVKPADLAQAVTRFAAVTAAEPCDGATGSR